jgi:MFS transporter, YNFM family, putative membrane transport protein
VTSAAQPGLPPPEEAALAGTDQLLPEVALNRSRSLDLGPISSVFAVFLCGVFAFIDLYATQPLLPLFARLFGASKAAVGLTVSASTLGVALSAPFFGVFAERLSRKRVIVCSILALALPTLLAATSSSLHLLIFWRFLQGLVMPGIFAITIAYITEEWPRQSVAIVMSVYVSGTALGGFIGRMTSGLAAEYLNWHYSFLFLGAITVVGAAAVARWLPRERRSIASHTAAGFRARFLPMGGHLRNPRLLATYAVGFNVLFSLVGVFTYITFYLADPPFRLSTVALSYLFVVYLVGLVVTPGAGWVVSRIGLRRGMISAVAVSMAGVLVTLIPRLPAVIFGLAMVCTGVFISQSTASSHLRDAASEGGRVSAAGLYLSFYYLGGTAAGVIPSYFWRLGKWPACVAFIVSLQLITVTIALLGWRSEPYLASNVVTEQT